ncbi:MAG: glycosyltransferase family 4 protein [Bacteroidota bacterium]
MKKINILYLSYDGMTDQLGQSQVIPYLVGLSEKNYSITIISCEKKDAFEKGRIKIKELLDRHNILWEPLLYTKDPPVLSTIYDLGKIKKKAAALFNKTNFEIVHCRSYITGMVGLSLKKKYQCKFIFDMRGFYADERVDGKLWNLNNPVYKIIYNYFKKKEKVLLLNADYIISLTQNAKQIINSWKLNTQNELPIEVIPCCVDMNLFSPDNIDAEKKVSFRKELKITKENFVLSYLGALGTWYMLDEMLDFFKILQNKKPNSIFLFITPEDKQQIVQEAAEKNIAQDKLIFITANRDDVPALISLSDASIFFIKPVFSKRASSPTKQGEIMSMGIPIICNSMIGDTDTIIEESDSGIVIKSFDDKNYSEAIKKMESFKYFNPQKSREAAKKYFSLEKGIESYQKVYNSVLNKV